MELKCGSCQLVKLAEEFYSSSRRVCKSCDSASNKKWRNKNKVYNEKRVKQWKEQHPEKVRMHVRKSSRKYYGLPIPTRPEAQHCDICGSPPGKRSLSLDHDHLTGKFRGWLCGRCNTGLGMFKEQELSLYKAIQYLKANKINLPVDPQERKNIPIFTGCIQYFPLALIEVAKLSHAGNIQHNPGMPLFWNREKSGDETDALMRHLLHVGTTDEDGIKHSVKLVWRALAFLQKEMENLKKLEIDKENNEKTVFNWEPKKP